MGSTHKSTSHNIIFVRIRGDNGDNRDYIVDNLDIAHPYMT